MKENKIVKIIVIMIAIILFILSMGIGTYIFFNNNGKVDEVDSVEKEEMDNNEAKPLLYEVSKEGSTNKIYLFGSIHAADDRVYPMPKRIMEAYRESEYLAVEFDVVDFEKDLKKQMNSMQYLIYNDGTKISDYLREDTYNMMIKYLKDNNSYMTAYDVYKPAMFYSLISNVQVKKSKIDSSKGIDYYFLNKAKEDKKKILEIESSQEQYKLLGEFSNEIMDFLIRLYIDYEEDFIEETNTLYENWLRGDDTVLIDDIEKIDEDEDYEKYFQIYGDIRNLILEYNKLLVYNRNDSMSLVADNYFKEGKNVFYVVGFAHIIGEKGIVKQLENMGYHVEVVSY